LANGDRSEIAVLIKTLHLYKQAQREKSLKMKSVDDGILKEAERILHEELAYVLKIKKDQVVPFILDKIESLNSKDA
jgi:CarD family transcriptional regulator